MSGHRKFSELTKHFTHKDRKVIEAKKAKMRAAMDLEGPHDPSEIVAEPSDDKASSPEQVRS